jgi:class 3 adenylate cyclase/tetratricopeptide (TPR) repeat protein
LVTICPACGTENAPDARFCSTCGTPLATLCAKCGAPLPEDARFCPACGASVDDAGAAPSNERKLVTVLFADVTGSTTLGEQLDPEDLRAVFDTYFSAMREEIVAEGGTVEKFIGDAVMAAFGVPAAHEDDPSRALRAALRMLRRLDAVNEELTAQHGVTLAIRIGVNTGEVLATTEPRPGEPMVTGDVVNAAARLQSLAEPGSVVAGERTRRAARGFRFEDLGSAELKGKAERVRIHRLAEETGLGAERGVPGLRAPMVGRDAELDVLRSVFQRIEVERRPHLVTIYGDAGVGKSRLTLEFLRWTDGLPTPPVVLRGRCLPYGDGITYWPLAEILKSHAGILDSDPPQLAVEKVRKIGRELLTTDVAADPVRATAALAYTVGLEDPDTPFAGADPRDVRDELHTAWRSFFTALAASGPLITVVEDIHWADPALLDLLEELAERVDGAAMFLCPSRPDLSARRPGWGGGRRNASSVALDPLSSEHAETLVRLLLTVDDLPAPVRARILEQAEGNPFYLEEIIRSLIDGGHLFREDDRWRAGQEIGSVQIPDTVQAVLASRIDLLDPGDKRILQAAAVVGRVFWPGPVADLSGVDVVDVADALRRLEDRELVFSRAGSTLSGQPELLFKHVLTRDVAYESLPRRDRASAHRAVARWIERTAGERVGEFAELLAYHLGTSVAAARGAGDEPDPADRAAAVAWLVRASRDVRRRLALSKAQRLAEHAVQFAGTDAERIDALEALGETAFTASLGDLGWRSFREAALLAASSHADGERVAYLAARACETPQRWPGSMRGAVPTEAEVKAILDLGMAALPPGDSEARIRLLGVRAGWPFGYPDPSWTEVDLLPFEAAGVEAAEVALRMGLPNLASGALDAANAAWASQGLYGRVLPVWERRSSIQPLVTDVAEVGDCFAMGAWTLFELGRYADALVQADEGIAHVTGKEPGMELHARCWRIAALQRLGRWDEALDEYERVVALLGEGADHPPYFVTHGIAVAALICELRGDRATSDRMTSTMLSLMTVQAGRLYPFMLRVLIARGDLERARSIALPSTWRVHANDTYEARAELLAASGSWDKAPALLLEMREHAERAGTVALVPFADRLEGRASLASGDPTTAAGLLRRAADRFEELSARWERALTFVDLARSLAEAGKRDDARAALDDAMSTFTALRSVRDLERARDVL